MGDFLCISLLFFPIFAMSKERQMHFLMGRLRFRQIIFSINDFKSKERNKKWKK